MIPVIFIHKGDQDYLKTAIGQAKRYNERVVLIGNEKNKTFTEEWVPWKRLYHHHFAKVYQHMNWTHESQILRNIERWFAISRWMEWKKEDQAFCLDSDVMVYADLDEVVETWPSPAAGLAIPRKPWPAGVSASGHCSYWTQSAIRDFSEFIYRMYTTDRGLAALQYKWAAHMLARLPGGVCDMTLLYIWSIGKDVVNTAKVIEQATFDENINISGNLIPDEYRMKDGIKEVKTMDDWPHGFHEHRQEWIAFNCLHFQGKAKRLMEGYKG